MTTVNANPSDANPDGTVNLHRRPSVDKLPEFMTYTDTGCAVSPMCLHCPREQCRYDEAAGSSNDGKGGRPVPLGRDAAIWERYQAMEGGKGGPWGRTERVISTIAGEFDVTRRTVFRVLRKRREGKE